MFRGPHFIVSTMQAGTTPIFNVFGMTGPSSNRESNPQILLVSAGSPLSLPFTISRGYWGPIRHQGAPSGAPNPGSPHVNQTIRLRYQNDSDSYFFQRVPRVMTQLDVKSSKQHFLKCWHILNFELTPSCHFIDIWNIVFGWTFQRYAFNIP